MLILVELALLKAEWRVEHRAFFLRRCRPLVAPLLSGGQRSGCSGAARAGNCSQFVPPMLLLTS